MNDEERFAWRSFVAVVQNFLGNHMADNYVELVEDNAGSIQRVRL